MFPTFHSCRYDIQIWDGARWIKHLPEVKIRFNDYDQNLETLNTIKRMNDISDRRIAEAANTGMYEARRGNLKTEIQAILMWMRENTLLGTNFGRLPFHLTKSQS